MPSTAQISRMVYEAEAAESLGVPYRVLRNERYQGRIAYHRVASRIMYTQKSLDEWRQARAHPEYGSKIYFVQAEPGTPIKIGFTEWERPQRRVDALQSGNPYVLRLICVAPGDMYLEKALHREFAEDRLNGEWFRCSDRLLTTIKQIKKGTSVAEVLKLHNFSGQENRPNNSVKHGQTAAKPALSGG